MKIKWRKWNNILHRNLGYFFFGVIIIYSVSGIALNHLKDWNPSYIVENKHIQINNLENYLPISSESIKNILTSNKIDLKYKTHYKPNTHSIKIFLEGGSLNIDLNTKSAIFESVRRRPVFYQFNYLHYNPGKLWTWFSDFFALALIIISVTGLFVIKGKNGIKKRGIIIVGIGLLVTLIIIFI